MIRTFDKINAALFNAGFIYSYGNRFVTDGGSSFVRTYECDGKYIKVISPAEDDDSVKTENVRVLQVSHAKLGRKHIAWTPGLIVRL
jgi:hypothetical protein